MRRKDDIVGNKTGCYNKEGKGKTREQEKRSLDSSKKKKRKSQILACAHVGEGADKRAA